MVDNVRKGVDSVEENMKPDKKRKKKWVTILLFMSILVFLSGSYYLSYKVAYDHFQNTDLAKRLKEESEASGALEVNAGNETIVHKNMTYVEEIYDRTNGELSQVEKQVPSELLGLTKNQLAEYLKAYTNKMSVEEKNDGLKNFELISFSSNNVVVRKTYDENTVSGYEYYIILEDGNLKVYYGDQETLYMDTKIAEDELSESEKVKLEAGMYLHNIWEVYHYLESYTSSILLWYHA